MTLRVVRLVLDQDLRAVHEMRDRVRCKAGECWLFVNSARTMARYGLWNGMLLGYWHHDYYPGQVINADALVDEVGAGLRVRLLVNELDRRRIDRVETERRKAA
jgi:hypothetical protein